MIINGTVTSAGQASPPQGQYGVRYQDVTITDQQGYEHHGRIGSKQGYDVGTPIQVTVVEKQGQDGPYNYFKKYNPQYQQQTAPQQPQQAPSPPTQRPNASKEVDWDAKECRTHRAMCTAYAKDLVIDGKLDINQMDKWVKERVAFIWDGIIKSQPNPNQMAQEFEEEMNQPNDIPI